MNKKGYSELAFSGLSTFISSTDASAADSSSEASADASLEASTAASTVLSIDVSCELSFPASSFDAPGVHPVIIAARRTAAINSFLFIMVSFYNYPNQ